MAHCSSPAPAFVVCEVIWAVSVTAIGAAVEVAIAEAAVAPTLIMCCLPAHGCYVAWHRSRLMLAAWDAAAARLVCKRCMSVCQSFSKLHPEFGVDMTRLLRQKAQAALIQQTSPACWDSDQVSPGLSIAWHARVSASQNDKVIFLGAPKGRQMHMHARANAR